MRDLAYLELLSRQFPSLRLAAAEMINLRAICALPKGTEYFFSDIHGEHESFIHLLHSSSGIVRAKIDERFAGILSGEERRALAELIYYPREQLQLRQVAGACDGEWERLSIYRLIRLCRDMSSKYTRSKVRKKLPAEYAYAIDELLNVDDTARNKREYHQEIMNAIVEVGAGGTFIVALCELIQSLAIDSLHIIGDIFDRGPRPDLIMEELMRFHDVDIQWGNHDISWMGAAAGNTACIANVLRIAISYNAFDMLEDGYGINLRPLSMFAAEVYRDDPCSCFAPHLLDENLYDAVSPELTAKMNKAITVIQLKLEGALIRRHPEYGMEERRLLERIDFERGCVKLNGRCYPLRDTRLPTVDPREPLRLTPGEAELMHVLAKSFEHSRLLHRHVNFLYSHGAIYKICNGNLLYHGCIPFEEDGSLMGVDFPEGRFSGRALMDYLNQKIIDAYFLDERMEPERKAAARDLMWYLWCGPKSPLFGKDKMTCFEHYFLEAGEHQREQYNPYYRYAPKEAYALKILREFGLEGPGAHIINGHVPVRTGQGESPIKAGGRLFIIDGGLSKAYQSKTGIAGYTLIYNSQHLALAEHKPYAPGADHTPSIRIVEQMKERVRVRDTDIGLRLLQQIEDLKALVEAYRQGLIKERP